MEFLKIIDKLNLKLLICPRISCSSVLYCTLQIMDDERTIFEREGRNPVLLLMLLPIRPSPKGTKVWLRSPSLFLAQQSREFHWERFLAFPSNRVEAPPSEWFLHPSTTTTTEMEDQISYLRCSYHTLLELIECAACNPILSC